MRQALEAAARLGVKGIEFDAVGELAPDQLSQTGRRHLTHLIRSYDLTLTGLGFPTRRGFHELEHLEARVAGAFKALSLAFAVGAPMVIHPMGVIPADRKDPRNAFFYESMTAISHEAVRVGARFAIETGLDLPETLAKFLQETESGGLAVHYNPANLLPAGVDVYEKTVELLGGSIVGVHVKDVVRSGMTVSGFRETPVGEGDVDWRRLLGSLASVDYYGFWTLAPERTPVPPQEILDAADYLRGL
jgi:sugar phosphate isomerase/epimerase